MANPMISLDPFALGIFIQMLSVGWFVLILYISILTVRAGRKRLLTLGVLSLLMFSGFLTLILIDMMVFKPHSEPVWVQSLQRLPMGWYLAAEGIGLILTGLIGADLIRFEKDTLNEADIKNTMDLLPAGICFGSASGEVRMKNVQMNEISQSLMEEYLTDIHRFWEGLARLGEKSGESILVHTSEGTMLFVRTKVRIGKEELLQITATDVSEQFSITRKLRETNRHLKEYQSRMKQYQQLSAQMIRSEEILSARRTVHDQVGHVLLTASYAYAHPENTDRKALLEILRQTNNFLLREAREDDSGAEDPIRLAVSRAEAIGVEVRISGPLPEDEKIRLLLGDAIRECAANTVKHGGGDTLEVRIERTDGALLLSLSNNGSATSEHVRETGGLLSLRKEAEAQQGTMSVMSLPVFTVTFTFPEDSGGKEE